MNRIYSEYCLILYILRILFIPVKFYVFSG